MPRSGDNQQMPLLASIGCGTLLAVLLEGALAENQYISIAALNIVASPHPAGIYSLLLEEAAEVEAPVWGDDWAFITKPKRSKSKPEWLSAIPNLLGFSVGAMAIVLALSSAPLFRRIAKQGDPASYFMVLTSSLLHFIVVQVMSLLFGIIGKLTGIRLLDPIIVFFLFYAILVVLSAGVQLFQTSTIYNAAAGLPDSKSDL